MTARQPAVGDLLIVDGITRRITSVKWGALPGTNDGEFAVFPDTVEFDHPDPEAEQVRRQLMAGWKARRAAAGAEFTELPPEPSRAGATGAQWLRWMDGLNCWALEGRVEARSEKSGAVVLTPAVARVVGINPTGG